MQMISFACKDIEFKDLLRCSFELNKTEYNLFIYLLKHTGYSTIETLASSLALDRTTVQKAVKKLVSKQLVTRFQENLGKGGYIFHYKISNKEEIKQTMQKIVENWHENVIAEIQRW